MVCWSCLCYVQENDINNVKQYRCIITLNPILILLTRQIFYLTTLSSASTAIGRRQNYTGPTSSPPHPSRPPVALGRFPPPTEGQSASTTGAHRNFRTIISTRLLASTELRSPAQNLPAFLRRAASHLKFRACNSRTERTSSVTRFMPSIRRVFRTRGPRHPPRPRWEKPPRAGNSQPHLPPRGGTNSTPTPSSLSWRARRTSRNSHSRSHRTRSKYDFDDDDCDCDVIDEDDIVGDDDIDSASYCCCHEIVISYYVDDDDGDVRRNHPSRTSRNPKKKPSNINIVGSSEAISTFSPMKSKTSGAADEAPGLPGAKVSGQSSPLLSSPYRSPQLGKASCEDASVQESNLRSLLRACARGFCADVVLGVLTYLNKWLMLESACGNIYY